MKFCPDSIPVHASEYRGIYMLTVPVPEGWDDVRRILSRVILREGKRYVFTGWNSDRNEAYFKHDPSCIGILS